MQPIRLIRSRCVVLAADNVDTDQIIPARFLKGTTREGLGRHLFADWAARPPAEDGQVLVAGANFGCGSSREHAVWALLDAGFRAVVSPKIADIFRANALKNGLVPVVVEPEFHRLLREGMDVSIDLESLRIEIRGGPAAAFALDPFARYCLLNGVDEMGFLLAQSERITEYERRACER
ncbi:MAG: 3-isopropylmalate dehydratase small subunit [Planctomycetes bacterium]|nr:3-isopropylmalate dehydratase small subunit [Planctomycetota bacterium]